MDLIELAQHRTAQRHPWELARCRFVGDVLAAASLPGPGGEVLDVGSGDAWLAAALARRLEAAGRFTCWDRGYAGGVPAGVADAGDRLRFTAERPAARFPLVLLLDVLEHVEDEQGFLSATVRENLAPGGHAVVTVPAWPRLFSAHDARLGHHRRYTPDGARALLAAAGLEVVRSGGLFHSLLLPRAASVLLARLLPSAAPPAGASGWAAPAPVTAAVVAALALDARLSLLTSRLGAPLPGLSFWALCRRP